MSGQNSGIYNTGATQVSVGKVVKSSQVYSFPITLVSGTIVTLDLKPLANMHRIENVQGIFLDNSNGSIAFTLKTVAGQVFTIPAGFQGVMPLYLSADNTITISGNGTINITLLNFPTPAAVWPTAAATTVSITGTVTVQDVTAEGLLATIQNQITPASGSVASSVNSVSTQLFAANAARQSVVIQSAYKVATGIFYDLWVNFLGGTAGVGLVDCLRIPAGQAYESNYKVSIDQINYFDAVGTNEITAWQG